MSFNDHLDRLDEAVESHLSDGTCRYETSGGTVIEDVPYILDRDFEAQDNDEVALRVTTISVRSSRVSSSEFGDVITAGGRAWKVQEILEDDGQWRRLYVT